MIERSKSYKLPAKRDIFSRILFYCLFAAFSLCLSPLAGFHTAQAADVTLSWDKNTEKDIAGYKVFSGTSSSNYNGTTYDAGNFTSITASGLQAGTTYYFAAKAYNTSGLESGFSNQVSYAVPSNTTTTTSTTTPTTTTTTSSTSTNTATYALTPYITEGKSYGSISPSARVYVASGSSQTFNITPKTGYQIKEVSVDGSSIGTPTSYTFNNVQQKHYIAVKFMPQSTSTATTTTTSTGTSSTSTSSTSTSTASTATYALTPYITEGKSYGSVSPSARVYAASGSSQTFTFTPVAGHSISSVSVDGSYIGTPTSYTFNNIKQKHYIDVKFK